MSLATAYYELQHGWFLIEDDGGVITRIERVTNAIDGQPSTLTDTVADQLREYFAGERRNFDFPFEMRGTAFQKQVWAALTRIPYGQTRSYGQIAKEIGSPQASRAVGMANNHNPLLVVIPCHRVVGADGSLTGYAAGLDMKKALLALEGADLSAGR